MESFPALVNFMNLLTGLIGVVLVGMSVFKFIEFDRSNGQVRLITPFMYLFVGAALYFFSTSADTMLATVFGGSTSVNSLLSYSGSGVSDKQAQFIKSLVMVVRLIGYVAFIKGWLLLKKIGDGSQGSDEAFSKALIHILFGVLAINIVATVNVISSTFGLGDVMR